FATYERGAFWIGPLAFPGGVGFLEARRRLLRPVGETPSAREIDVAVRGMSAQVAPDAHAAERRLLELGAREITSEVERLRDRQRSPELLDAVVAVAERRLVYSIGREPEATTGAASPGRDLGLEIDVIGAR